MDYDRIVNRAGMVSAAGILFMTTLNGTAHGAGTDVTVQGRRTLPQRLAAERVAVGNLGDYKPCIAKLPCGELIMIAFRRELLGGDRFHEPVILYRSQDGGRSWSTVEVLDALGREPYLSLMDDGTLFVTSHMLHNDAKSEADYGYSYLHRSTDGGRSWQRLAVTADALPGCPAKPKWILTSRNLLKLADGSIVFGVDVRGTGQYLWRSRDGGVTWDKSIRCTFMAKGIADKPAEAWWPSGVAESIFFQARNGDLLWILRVESDKFAPIPDTTVVEMISDQYERLVVFRSTDGGTVWRLQEEIGSHYGEMYPAVLRLNDGRLLLTFTVRAVRPPLGVHAVFGRETPDGFEFDFEHDRMVIDDKTPQGLTSGGGFGPTVQLDDGTLINAHSYRVVESDEPHLQTRIEVVRWKLPPAP